MASRTLKLTRSSTVPDTSTSVTGYRLVVSASDGNNIDDRVFRVRVLTLSDDAEDIEVIYEGICTPVEMNTLPTSYDSTVGIYYRTDSVSLFYETLADEGWSAIKADVDQLIETLNISDRLSPPEIYTAGQ
jgi:hypothetical protein